MSSEPGFEADSPLLMRFADFSLDTSDARRARCTRSAMVRGVAGMLVLESIVIERTISCRRGVSSSAPCDDTERLGA